MIIGKSLKRALIAVAWLLAVFAAALFIGCKSAGSRLQSEIDRLPWRADTPDTPAPALPPAPAPDPEPTPLPPAVDSAPVPDPVPAEADQFIWEPRADSVRIVIPASLPHWQLHLVSRSLHHTVYGPDKSKAREYILPGSGASWGAKAAALDSKSGPQLMVYINTYALQATGHKSAGWRILDPTKRVAGDDGTRLQKGENK
jgi:hypothetical protein